VGFEGAHVDLDHILPCRRWTESDKYRLRTCVAVCDCSMALDAHTRPGFDVLLQTHAYKFCRVLVRTKIKSISLFHSATHTDIYTQACKHTIKGAVQSSYRRRCTLRVRQLNLQARSTLSHKHARTHSSLHQRSAPILRILTSGGIWRVARNCSMSSALSVDSLCGTPEESLYDFAQNHSFIKNYVYIYIHDIYIYIYTYIYIYPQNVCIRLSTVHFSPALCGAAR
jgi:hypothetical protein